MNILEELANDDGSGEEEGGVDAEATKKAWFWPKLCIPFYNSEKLCVREREKREIEKRIVIQPNWKQL